MTLPRFVPVIKRGGKLLTKDKGAAPLCQAVGKFLLGQLPPAPSNAPLLHAILHLATAGIRPRGMARPKLGVASLRNYPPAQSGLAPCRFAAILRRGRDPAREGARQEGGARARCCRAPPPVEWLADAQKNPGVLPRGFQLCLKLGFSDQAVGYRGTGVGRHHPVGPNSTKLAGLGSGEINLRDKIASCSPRCAQLRPQATVTLISKRHGTSNGKVLGYGRSASLSPFPMAAFGPQATRPRFAWGSRL